MARSAGSSVRSSAGGGRGLLGRSLIVGAVAAAVVAGSATGALAGPKKSDPVAPTTVTGTVAPAPDAAPSSGRMWASGPSFGRMWA
ncbi:hypothetical protein [Blastococcus saxobsidens]|uniref:Uncharacterized protein n=1 Tax=Blastococcus saxobsidens (strain DD2) TaxID=1146883 RepID=H6RL50_BLASD|nr:hypothetical protein [Blastococcus saxobsidens]CCG01180.1 protein of unknown function [Blastococcus saxobsidens DD2]